MGVTRTNNIPGLPGNNNFKVMEAGARKLGYKEVHTGRMAINSEPRDGRGSCQQIGFCFQGCKSGAKWSTLYTEIPKGEATGNLEVRPGSMALKIEHDASGKVTGVVYADEAGKTQRQKARIVAVAGNSIESPRLLLNSASSAVPRRPRQQLRPGRPQLHAAHDRQRLCGVRQVGAHVPRHHHGRHHPRRGASTTRHAASWAAMRWRRCRSACPSWRRSSIRAPGAARSPRRWRDIRAWPACGWSARTCRRKPTAITLDPKAKDTFGLPVASVHYDDHPNDIAMRDHAYKQGAAVYEAVGATVTYPTTPYPSTHNLGTNRMSAKAEGRRRQQVRPDPRHQESVRFGRQPVHHRRGLQSDADHRGARHPAGGSHRRRDAAKGNLATAQAHPGDAGRRFRGGFRCIHRSRTVGDRCCYSAATEPRRRSIADNRAWPPRLSTDRSGRNSAAAMRNYALPRNDRAPRCADMTGTSRDSCLACSRFPPAYPRTPSRAGSMCNGHRSAAIGSAIHSHVEAGERTAGTLVSLPTFL